ncbi:TPA: hypothetical protein ACRMI2_006583, partial [Pseudomonas aeruginosa]
PGHRPMWGISDGLRPVSAPRQPQPAPLKLTHMRLSARHGLALRISFFALMLLSVVARPMVIQLSELHGLEHDIAAAVDHGHSHAGGAGDNLDPDHATGAHAVLHQADASFAGSLFTPHVYLASLPLAGEVHALRLLRVPAGHPASPFRPPIV